MDKTPTSQEEQTSMPDVVREGLVAAMLLHVEQSLLRVEADNILADEAEPGEGGERSESIAENMGVRSELLFASMSGSDITADDMPVPDSPQRTSGGGGGSGSKPKKRRRKETSKSLLARAARSMADAAAAVSQAFTRKVEETGGDLENPEIVAELKEIENMRKNIAEQRTAVRDLSTGEFAQRHAELQEGGLTAAAFWAVLEMIRHHAHNTLVEGEYQRIQNKIAQQVNRKYKRADQISDPANVKKFQELFRAAVQNGEFARSQELIKEQLVAFGYGDDAQLVQKFRKMGIESGKLHPTYVLDFLKTYKNLLPDDVASFLKKVSFVTASTTGELRIAATKILLGQLYAERKHKHANFFPTGIEGLQGEEMKNNEAQLLVCEVLSCAERAAENPLELACQFEIGTETTPRNRIMPTDGCGATLRKLMQFEPHYYLVPDRYAAEGKKAEDEPELKIEDRSPLDLLARFVPPDTDTTHERATWLVRGLNEMPNLQEVLEVCQAVDERMYEKLVQRDKVCTRNPGAPRDDAKKYIEAYMGSTDDEPNTAIEALQLGALMRMHIGIARLKEIIPNPLHRRTSEVIAEYLADMRLALGPQVWLMLGTPGHLEQVHHITARNNPWYKITKRILAEDPVMAPVLRAFLYAASPRVLQCFWHKCLRHDSNLADTEGLVGVDFNSYEIWSSKLHCLQFLQDLRLVCTQEGMDIFALLAFYSQHVNVHTHFENAQEEWTNSPERRDPDTGIRIAKKDLPLGHSHRVTETEYLKAEGIKGVPFGYAKDKDPLFMALDQWFADRPTEDTEAFGKPANSHKPDEVQKPNMIPGRISRLRDMLSPVFKAHKNPERAAWAKDKPACTKMVSLPEILDAFHPSYADAARPASPQDAFAQTAVEADVFDGKVDLGVVTNADGAVVSVDIQDPTKMAKRDWNADSRGRSGEEAQKARARAALEEDEKHKARAKGITDAWDKETE